MDESVHSPPNKRTTGRWVIPPWAQLLLVMSIIVAFALYLIREDGTDNRDRELEAIRRIMQSADSFSEKSGKPPFYEAFRSDPEQKQRLGICFLTTDVFPDERGYAGPIHVMVGLDNGGKITGIEILSHNETPSYVRPMYEPWFTEQFQGKSIGDGFRLGEDIQGITRATMTSEAIAQGVRKSSRKMAALHLGLQAPDEPDSKATVPWADVGVLLILFAIALIGIITVKKFLLWVALAGSFTFLGILKISPLSTIHFLNLIMGNTPPLHQGIFIYSLLGAATLSAITLGRVYCRGICPFGAIQEVLHRVSPFRSLSQGLSEKMKGRKGLRIIPYLVLWILAMIAFITKDTKAASIEPYLFLFGFRGSILAWFLTGIVLFWGFFYRRFWCRIFCPVGAALDLLGKLSPFNKLRKNEKMNVSP